MRRSPGDPSQLPPPCPLPQWDRPLAAARRPVGRPSRRGRLGQAPGRHANQVVIHATDQKISRTNLFELAEADRDEQSSRSVLEFFRNTLAWGIAGDWRNVSGIAKAVRADSDRAIAALRRAQHLSFASQIQEAHQGLSGAIKHFGPAFATKILSFCTDRTQAVYPLVLDDRVSTGWRVLTGEHIKAPSSASYAHFCQAAGGSAARADLRPEEAEACLYHLTRQVGS